MNSEINNDKNNSQAPRSENFHEAVWLRRKRRSAKVRAAVIGVIGVAIACAVLTGNAQEGQAAAGGQAASIGK